MTSKPAFISHPSTSPVFQKEEVSPVESDFARKAFGQVGQGLTNNNMMQMVYAEYQNDEEEPEEVSDN